MMSSDNVMYQELSAEDIRQQPAEIESLCPNCEETGITKLLLTKVPFYKEVILMSFNCDHCGCQNNEIQSGSKVQEQGIKISVKITGEKDLNRQVVKSEYAGISVPEVELEIAQRSQSGEITTVEGVIRRTRDSLDRDQVLRRIENPETAEKLDRFLEKLDKILKLDQPFTLMIDDPSGNSFVENPIPYQIDPQMTIIHYHRTLQHEKMLGLIADDEVESEDSEQMSRPVWESKDELKNEVLHFEVQCPNCDAQAQSNMKVVNIPNFKEVVIMATNCEFCGHRTNEVKSGTGISEKGIKLSLQLSDPDDMSRDLLKSETCNLCIPQLELELGMGALGGRFTTVQGLLIAVRDQLNDLGSLVLGDSAEISKKDKMEEVIGRLDDIIAMKSQITLILDDPAGNSYIESLTAPFVDPRLKVEYYDRNFEQNDELGLNDMKTEEYKEQD